MNFGDFASPRPAACGCTCHDPGPLAKRLKDAAAEYVSMLVDGSTFDWAIDGKTLAPLWAYLFEAIRSAGFTVSVRAEGGTTVYEVRKQRLEATT